MGFFRRVVCIPLRYTFLLFTPILFVPTAAACCPRTKIFVSSEFFKSRYVVIGTVASETTELDSEGSMVAWDYQVKVLETYRGTRHRRLRIRAENDSGRFLMEKGQRYLIFARRFEGHLAVDNCGNSQLLSDADGAIDAIKQIFRSGPYGEIEVRVVDGQDGVAGVRFVARSATAAFSGATGDDGVVRLRVPPGKYALTAKSSKFLVVPYDLNEDDPDHFFVHTGGTVQFDYDLR